MVAGAGADRELLVRGAQLARRDRRRRRAGSSAGGESGGATGAPDLRADRQPGGQRRPGAGVVRCTDDGDQLTGRAIDLPAKSRTSVAGRAVRQRRGQRSFGVLVESLGHDAGADRRRARDLQQPGRRDCGPAAATRWRRRCRSERRGRHGQRHAVLRGVRLERRHRRRRQRARRRADGAGGARARLRRAAAPAAGRARPASCGTARRGRRLRGRRLSRPPNASGSSTCRNTDACQPVGCCERP